MPDIDIKLQYHSPDRAFAAVFVRDEEPWYLDGALVGMSGDPGDAVAELIEQAIHMVTTGESLLIEGEIELEDRIWLFKLMDQGSLANDQMYAAVREANGGLDPYGVYSIEPDPGPFVTKTGRVLTDQDIEHLADEAERGYDIQPCGFQWREAPQPGEEHEGPFVIRTCTLGKGHRKPIDHHDRNAPNA